MADSRSLPSQPWNTRYRIGVSSTRRGDPDVVGVPLAPQAYDVKNGEADAQTTAREGASASRWTAVEPTALPRPVLRLAVRPSPSRREIVPVVVTLSTSRHLTFLSRVARIMSYRSLYEGGASCQLNSYHYCSHFQMQSPSVLSAWPHILPFIERHSSSTNICCGRT